MSKGYIALPRASEEDQMHKEHGMDYESMWPRQKSRSPLCLSVFLSISVITNLVGLGYYQGLHKKFMPAHEQNAPSTYAKQVELPTIYKTFHWNTEYSSPNLTYQDQLWEDILPSHGFVAIDRDEAAELGYPESMYLPGDKGKGVYLLEAYHQLHCLRILHKTMRESLMGVEFTWKPGSHIEHCFDYLIQTTMCNADTTPLYTFGDNTAGDRQVHKCKDWNALRDYATEKRACYRDTIADVPLGDHFGYCDSGEDGVLNDVPRIERMVDHGH